MEITDKGISPVTSTLIILATGIAVAIFFASWITFVVPTFARHEELRIQNCIIANPRKAIIYIKNTGSIDLTINHILVNGRLSNPGEPVNTTLESGDSISIEVDPIHYTDVKEFKSGTRYDFIIHTVTGLSYPISARAP